jgi:hypothetical protein
MAILEKVIQEVSTRLEQHIALRSIQCWQQITRDPAFSSPEQYRSNPKQCTSKIIIIIIIIGQCSHLRH